MSLPSFSIHRPVFTTMVTLIVILLGVISLTRLPIDLMPDVTFPAISISTEYENASPEVIEELVTRPIEQALAAVPGVDTIISTSQEGQSRVRVFFTWATDIEAATGDVRDRVDRVVGRLPEDAERPVLSKFDTSDMPILFCGVSSHMDQIDLRNEIDDNIKFRIERIDGVASLNIWGGREREIRVELDPARLKAFRIPVDVALAAIRDANLNKPAGFVDHGIHEVTLRAPGDFTSLDEIRETAVVLREGQPVRVRDIATVHDTYRQIRSIAHINGEPGMRLAIFKQSGRNTVAVARGVREELDRVNRDYRGRLEIVPMRDNSEYIVNSIANLSQSALLGGGLAVLILLVFLRNLRASVVIAIAIPIAIVATFALMFFGGFTLNMMSLGGLALGVGMLLDNSIVVLENITRLQEEGHDPVRAASEGSDEMFGAILASTLTTVVVFLPMVFLEGMAGVFMKEFSFVVGFSLLCSLIVAVTLVPMLAGLLLRPHRPRGGSVVGWMFNASERTLAALERRYVVALQWVVAHRLATLGVVALMILPCFYLVSLMGSENQPRTDEGDVTVTLEMDVGIQLALLDEKATEAEGIIRELVPEINTMMTTVAGGSRQGGGRNRAEIRLRLGGRASRRRYDDPVLGVRRMRTDLEIAGLLRDRLQSLEGCIVRTRANQSFGGGGTGGESGVSIEIRGYELETADALAAQVRALLEGVRGVKDVRVSREAGQPEAEFRIDRARAADMGLSVAQITEFIETCMAGKEAGNYRDKGKEYRVLVKVADAENRPPEEVLDLSITGADGRTTALANLMRMERTYGPVFIERKAQERVVYVSGTLQDRDLGSAMEEIRNLVDAEIVRPEGFEIFYGDEYEDQEEMFAELRFGLLAALLLVYMVMACQFESLKDPFVVMFSVPLAGIGALALLVLTGSNLSMPVMIGAIMLGGVVVNNAIILVDQINRLRAEEGYETRMAVIESGRRRLRPILMTSLTTVLGLIPMCLGWGEGGESQAPMARTVAGGLSSATFITLLFVPVVYDFFERGPWGNRPDRLAAAARTHRPHRKSARLPADGAPSGDSSRSSTLISSRQLRQRRDEAERE